MTVTLLSGHKIDNPLVAFRRLAEESGVDSFFPTSDRGLKRGLERIAAGPIHPGVLSAVPCKRSDNQSEGEAPRSQGVGRAVMISIT